jgi:hypothetical protein
MLAVLHRGIRAPLSTNFDEYNQSIENLKKKNQKIKKSIENRKENKCNNNEINNLQTHNNNQINNPQSPKLSIIFGGRTIIVARASLLRPWVAASLSSDSESSPILPHSSYLVSPLLSLSILSCPPFLILILFRNLSKLFSHRGWPSKAPIDRGRVKAPCDRSFHTSRCQPQR